MPFVEISLVLLLGAFVLIRLRRGAPLGRLLLQLVSVATTAWIAEDLAIRFYGDHSYAATWTWWADAVPVVIPAAWALIVLSGWELARALVRRHSAPLPWLAAGIVLVDVAVIGPIGAMLGAWQWQNAGLFGVSPALPLAAAAMTFAHVALWSSLDRRELRYWYHALAIPAGAIAVHAAGWSGWALAEWVAPVHPIFNLAIAWLAAAPVAAFFFAEDWHRRQKPDALPVRLVGAIVCGVLASVYATEMPLFLIYSLAIAMLYVALTPWARVFGRIQAAKLFQLPSRLVARTEAQAAGTQRPRAA